MKISNIIFSIKRLYKGGFDESTSRDKILYGNPETECTGIVTTCFASVEVIEKAALLGANLIICHEALFWNHGDHTEWLEMSHNRVFQKKIELLKKNGICVWRNHDYVHSGMLVDNAETYCDGIFYGLCRTMGWEKQFLQTNTLRMPMFFDIPEMRAEELAENIVKKCNLTGTRMIGNKDSLVKTVCILFHIWGVESDNEIITAIEKSNWDFIIVGELVDFTVAEYIRDASMLCGEDLPDRVIFNPGHFNGSLSDRAVKFGYQYKLRTIG